MRIVYWQYEVFAVNLLYEDGESIEQASPHDIHHVSVGNNGCWHLDEYLNRPIILKLFVLIVVCYIACLVSTTLGDLNFRSYFII